MAKPITHVHFILDNSGSMYSVRNATISGFNEYVETLKNDGNNYRLTLVKFGYDHEVVYEDKPIKDVPELNQDSYRADGVSTALYDAVCGTLSAEKKAKGKHIVVIMTDGFENSSREYNEKQMATLREELESTGQWSFIFLGSNQDAWHTAQRFGFARGNVATYNSTDKGTKNVFRAVGASTGFVAQSASMNTATFFNAEQKRKLQEEK